MAQTPQPNDSRTAEADQLAEEAERRIEAHNLAAEGKTRCDTCGCIGPTGDFTVLRAEFKSIRKPRQLKRTRTVRKLCPECLDADPIWNLPEKYI
jgi:hypothetical protein